MISLLLCMIVFIHLVARTRVRRIWDKTVNVDCDETNYLPLIGPQIPVLSADWSLVASLKSAGHTLDNAVNSSRMNSGVDRAKVKKWFTQCSRQEFLIKRTFSWFKWAGCRLTTLPPSTAQRVTLSHFTSCCISFVQSPLQVCFIWFCQA